MFALALSATPGAVAAETAATESAPTEVAAAEPLPYRVEYAAPAACGSRDAFLGELTARTPRVRLANPSEPSALFAVELTVTSEAVVGHLTLDELGGETTARSVTGKSCDEVVPALALIAAVLVDPDALSRSASAPSPAVSVSPPAPTPAAPEAAPPAASSRPDPSPPPPAESSDRARSFRFGVGAGVSLTSALSPNPAYGPFFELDLEHALNSLLLLSAGASIEHLSSKTLVTSAGQADFRATAARAWFCPLRLPARGAFALAPCAAFEAGAVQASGKATLDPQEVSRTWVAAGPLLRLEARPARSIAFSLDGFAVFPLVRDHFYFDPGVPVFSTPVVGVSGRLGVRVIFP